jgi:hypothetical protein
VFLLFLFLFSCQCLKCVCVCVCVCVRAWVRIRSEWDRHHPHSEEVAVHPPVQQWVTPGSYWFYTSAMPRTILDSCKTVLFRNSPVNDPALIQVDYAAARLTCHTEGLTITVELYHDTPAAMLTQVVVRHVYDADADTGTDLAEDSGSGSSSDEEDEEEPTRPRLPVSPFERYYCKLEQCFLSNTDVALAAMVEQPVATAAAGAVAAAAAACDGPVEKKPRLTK